MKSDCFKRSYSDDDSDKLSRVVEVCSVSSSVVLSSSDDVPVNAVAKTVEVAIVLGGVIVILVMAGVADVRVVELRMVAGRTAP